MRGFAWIRGESPGRARRAREEYLRQSMDLDPRGDGVRPPSEAEARGAVADLELLRLRIALRSRPVERRHERARAGEAPGRGMW